MLARKSPDWFIQLEVFHADVALQLGICNRIHTTTEHTASHSIHLLLPVHPAVHFHYPDVPTVSHTTRMTSFNVVTWSAALLWSAILSKLLTRMFLCHQEV